MEFSHTVVKVSMTKENKIGPHARSNIGTELGICPPLESEMFCEFFNRTILKIFRKCLSNMFNEYDICMRWLKMVRWLKRLFTVIRDHISRSLVPHGLDLPIFLVNVDTRGHNKRIPTTRFGAAKRPWRWKLLPWDCVNRRQKNRGTVLPSPVSDALRNRVIDGLSQRVLSQMVYVGDYACYYFLIILSRSESASSKCCEVRTAEASLHLPAAESTQSKGVHHATENIVHLVGKLAIWYGIWRTLSICCGTALKLL